MALKLIKERDDALKEAERARLASRDAEVEAIRKMDAVSARYKWREKNQQIFDLQSTIDKWLMEVDILKKTEKHERSVLNDIQHEYKLLNTSAQIWEEIVVWNSILDETSGENFYVNALDGRSSWDKPDYLCYYINNMTKESVWDPPKCVMDRDVMEEKMKEQENIQLKAQESVNTVLILLNKEKDKLIQMEEFAKMVKQAARDAATSKASQVLNNDQRSEHMKEVLTRIRKRAIEGPICYDCNSKRATRRCLSCIKPYCASCFNHFHNEGAMAGHSFLPIGKGSGLVGAGTKNKAGQVYDKKKVLF